MKIIDGVVLNLILIVFPILIYFIYHCYRSIFMEKYNNLILDVALFSSLYLCFKYGSFRHSIFFLFFCNLPIVLAYLKRQPYVAISLSVVIIFYYYNFNLFNVFLIIINFLLYFFIYLVGRKKNIKNNTFILAIVVIQGFFSSMYYFSVVRDGNIFMVVSIFFAILMFYIFQFLLLYLFQLADNITSLYLTVSEFEKNKKIKDSLFKITHEVKNPIAVCKGYLDMLDISNHDQVERYVPIIKSEISRSLDIMCDFMEFSKIKISKEVIDINLLLENIEDELKIFIRNKQIKLNTYIMKSEVFVEGDYNRLKQVFVNIVKNSIEAIDGYGVIKIYTHVLSGMCYIEFVDNGKGMDNEELNRVKEMFFTTKKNGSGLGVSLSDEIVKAHNGNIDYYSRVGVGTKVVVKLPIIMI